MLVWDPAHCRSPTALLMTRDRMECLQPHHEKLRDSKSTRSEPHRMAALPNLCRSVIHSALIRIGGT
jgi:hypothetical protein